MSELSSRFVRFSRPGFGVEDVCPSAAMVITKARETTDRMLIARDEIRFMEILLGNSFVRVVACQKGARPPADSNCGAKRDLDTEDLKEEIPGRRNRDK